MNTITFSKADFPEAGECEIGVEETLTVKIKPTGIIDDQVTADVTAVSYAEPVEEVPAPAPAKKSPISAIGVPGAKKY